MPLTEERKRDTDVYAALIQAAWNRFNSRRDVEWKTSIGMWSVFGAASVAVASSSWRPPVLTFWLALIPTAIILGLYSLVWLPYLAETMRRDQLVTYFWELNLHRQLGLPIPGDLHPGRFEPNSEWARLLEYVGTLPPIPVVVGEQGQPQGGNQPAQAGQGQPGQAQGGNQPPPALGVIVTDQRDLRRLHRSQWCQFGIAAAFAFLFLVVLGTKVYTTNEASGTRLSIEGPIQFDSASKVKIGP